MQHIRRFGLGLWLAAGVLWGQMNTGTVVGVVNDPQGLIMPGADITLTNLRTSDVRRTVSNEVGAFTFAGVTPSEYTLRVAKQGFQSYERTGMVLSAAQTLNAGVITLSVGSTAEAVTVTASTAAVQTASAENAAMLESKQLTMMMARGRDVISLLRLLPGVTQTAQTEALGSEIGTGTPNISGLRNNDNTVSVDGQISSDSDNINVHISAVSMEAIEEVKVLMNNFQAEYGRNAGAQVNIISKSGTREFHGNASWFKRHEGFNANDFFNNLNGLPRPRYRYSNWAGTLGGPVYLPGKFNSDRNKLFFFYGYEDWRASVPQSVQRTTMPTELERRGDFSRTLDLNGALIPVMDPATQRPIAGNLIPASRINTLGQAILNLLPKPNFLDTAVSRGTYNYQTQDVRISPKRLHQLKGDYNITDRDRLSVRWRKWRQDNRGYTVVAGFSGSNWDQLYHQYSKTEDSGLLNYTRTFSPSVVNELSFSGRKIGELGPPVSQEALDKVIKAKVGLGGLKQFFPEANPLGIVPEVSWGGVPNAPAIGYDLRFWIEAGDTRYSFADNLTWTKRNHIIKAGVYYEFNLADEGFAAPSMGGNFSFNVDRNNPLDSNQAFANSVFGNFRSYTESSIRNFRGGQDWIAEWFVQDSWKVNSRLTLELGARFSYYTNWELRPGQKGAAWVQERFDPKKQVVLFRPAFDQANRRVAQNPLNGQFAPAVLIGAIVPGHGDPYNGMVTGDDKTMPAGWRSRQPVQVMPRFGFAYDPFGRGKTAVRGAFGITKQTMINSAWANNLIATAPPIMLRPTIYYENINTFLGSSGYLFPPSSVRMFEKDFKTASIYNYSFGIQQDVGFDTVVNVGLVGNMGRHLIQNRNLNTIPYGARFLPQNADPTRPTLPLADSFFSPYVGYQTLELLENSGTSNYNSLQVTANRRFRRGLTFGAAWTWSKAMNLTDSNGRLPIYQNAKAWLYGKAGYDQTHALIFNYVWDLPRFSRRWDNPFSRLVLDNWQLSGFTLFASGTPAGVGFSTTDAADINGGGDGGRINVTGKAALEHGQRAFYRWFDTSVFARPARGDSGNAPKDIFRLPGHNNWDLSLFKSFPMGKESRILQLRSEFYNAFNHAQFAGVDTAARFDTQGRQVNARLGQVTGARSPRVVQFAVAFKF